MPFYRGDDVVWDITVPNVEGDGPFPLSGCSVYVTGKPAKEWDVPDAQAAWQLHIVIDGSGNVTTSDGLSLGVGGAAAGVLVAHLTAAKSAALSPGGYRYDVQVTDASGVVSTVKAGTDKVLGDITRAG